MAAGLDLSIHSGLAPVAADCLQGLGEVHASLGDPATAVEYLHRAVAARRGLDDASGVAECEALLAAERAKLSPSRPG